MAYVTVSNADMTRIADGIYVGEYDMFHISAEVKVTENDHVIINIELVKHSNSQGSAAKQSY